MSSLRRFAFASIAVGGLVVMAPGVALAHNLSLTPSSRCLEAGWEATVSVVISEPGPISGTTTSTYPSGSSVSWEVAAGEARSYGAGVAIPIGVSSVTFRVQGAWPDNTTFDESRTIARPESCVDVTTTTDAATTTTTEAATTTTAGATTTTVAGATTTTAPGATTTTPGAATTTVDPQEGVGGVGGVFPAPAAPAAPAAAPAAQAPTAGLPSTGTTTGPTSAVAAAAIVLGAAAIVVSKRRPVRSE